jgi:amino acid transporter
MAKAASALKRILVGRPMSSGELEHTLLPKIIALPVFSSDPLSSVTYATQEILLVLGTAGIAALTDVMPISFAVAGLLLIVVTSYRQTVRAYPTGGGAYRVSKENLGMYSGLLAASALLLDYVLTVSVSIVAGTDAIISAVPSLVPHDVKLSILFVAGVALLNLRGVRESGTLFAIPTYGFLLSIYVLIISGFVRCLGECPQAASAGTHLPVEHALGFLLILKAFSAGTTALTGVEAIADGVAAFRYPQSKNAATTLAVMGIFSVSMFLGISWLADHTNVIHTEHSEMTVVAEIAHTVFSGGFMFYVVQVMSAAILILAANTAYQDFPRLSSILAQDRFMPRQLMNRGDRLVFSNGVIILATLSSILIWIFNADLNKLIQLYLVGVFISFTLSQTGMVLRGRKLKEPGWKRRAAINGFGACVTGVVLCVVIASKFTHGAWIIITAIPIVIFLMRSIHKHYMEVAHQLAHPDRRPRDFRPGDQHMVIFIRRVDSAAARAVGYVRSIRPGSVEAITTDRSLHAAWKRLAPEIPLRTIDKVRWGGRTRRIRSYLRGRRDDIPESEFLTFVVPEVLERKGLLEVILRPRVHRLKASLFREVGICVLDIPLMRDEIDLETDQAHEPGRHYVCVLLSGVHNAALQALEFADTLRPTDVRAVTFGLDPESTSALGEEWLRERVQYPLEIEDSPFRDIATSLIHYIRQFNADGVDRVVTVVMPEFVVKKLRHSLLHNQTALIVKQRLLFEPGVVLASVTYPL